MLTDAEIQSKKEKGLYYPCEDRFTIDHTCKNKELQVLMIREMEVNDEKTNTKMADEGEPTTDEQDYTEVVAQGLGKSVELSINSVVGQTIGNLLNMRSEN